MKVKFDKSGVLFIERAGRMVEQFCPHGQFKNCCHHCPLLGEPFVGKDHTMNLVLCGKLLLTFDTFIDERG